MEDSNWPEAAAHDTAILIRKNNVHDFMEFLFEQTTCSVKETTLETRGMEVMQGIQ